MRLGASGSHAATACQLEAFEGFKASAVYAGQCQPRAPSRLAQQIAIESSACFHMIGCRSQLRLRLAPVVA
jgi:hypothetical protein